FAVGGGRQPARVALEQRQADVCLQVLEPLGEPRLRRMQQLGRMAEIARLGKAEQELQVAQAYTVGPVCSHGVFCEWMKGRAAPNARPALQAQAACATQAYITPILWRDGPPMLVFLPNFL